MNIQNYGLSNISFTGHKKKLDKTGSEVQQFYYLFDHKKYKSCEIELFSLQKDDKHNYSVVGEPITLDMSSGSRTVDMQKDARKIKTKDGFAYRFKLTDNDGKTTYAFDNGSVIGMFDGEQGNKYNVVLSNRAIINKNGPMQLIMPDSFNPKIDGKYPTPAESLKAMSLYVRNHANKLGGDFDGIIERLDELQKEGITRIVGTPFTKDRVSSHLYWTENAYQIAPNFGTTEDFKKLQEELFSRGMNWIADAALVNEGFGGIHMSELLRKGDESFAKNMFRTEGTIKLGIIPANSKFTRIKFVNAPFTVENGKVIQKQVDETKPTYIQFYDDRLASQEQKQSNEIFTTYDNKTTGNLYDITKHDDAVYPYSIEVDPEELKIKMHSLMESTGGDVDLSDINTIKLLSKTANFEVETKNQSQGLEVWDGNVDIAKLNFYSCKNDAYRFAHLPLEERLRAEQDFERGTLAVRDYAINSGKYWTKLTTDTLTEFVSKKLAKTEETPEAYLSAIQSLVGKGLPASTTEVVDLEVLENVLSGDYISRKIENADMKSQFYAPGKVSNNYYSKDDYILKQAMDFPLEALPFSTNLLGVITSPYIAKKANTEEELGVSRFDLAKSKAQANPNLPRKYKNTYEKADKMYMEQITPLISQILSGVNGIEEDGEISDYGRFVVTEIAPDLTKYLFIKALNPKANIKVSEDGKFDFTGVKESDYSLQSLGMSYNSISLEDEANIVMNKLTSGFAAIPQDDIQALKTKIQKRFENRTLNDYLVAEMIIDRTESGLGWRIDATKDIASIDSVRSGVDDMETTWDNVTSFWKKYNTAIREMNPHAYTTAEITDLNELFKRNPDEFGFDKGLYDVSKKLDDKNITTEELKNYTKRCKAIIGTDNVNGQLPDSKALAIGEGIIDAHEYLLGYNDTETRKAIEIGVKDYVTNNKTTKSINVSTMQNAVSHVLDVAEENGAHFTNRKGLEESFLRYLLGQHTKYDNDAEAERKFIEQTGITSVANYNYFFSLLPQLFHTENFEHGGPTYYATGGDTRELRKKLDTGWGSDFTPSTNPGFLFQSPADGIVNSYTFVGNHDKPRVLHCLALDMEMFYTPFVKTPTKLNEEKVKLEKDIKRLTTELEAEDISKEAKAEKTLIKSNKEKRLQDINDNILPKYKRAALVLGDEKAINGQVSGKAIAMGEKLRSAFATTIKDQKLDKDVENAINKAIAHLASGSYLGHDFDAEAFGTRPFEIAINSVLEEASMIASPTTSAKLTQKTKEKILAATLKNILEPAMDKYYSIYKLLTVLPGSPTDFAGDKVGSTGFETKAKNYHQQNRNFIHWEWLDKENVDYNFIKGFYKETTNISKLRSLPELSALNDGSTVTLPVEAENDWGEKNGFNPHLTGMLRYNEKDSVVITLHNNYLPANYAHADKIANQTSDDKTNSYDKIILCPANANFKQGLKHGMDENSEFKIAYGVDEKTGEIKSSSESFFIKKGKLGTKQEYYYLADKDGEPASIKIKPEDHNTVVLYKVD